MLLARFSFCNLFCISVNLFTDKKGIQKIALVYMYVCVILVRYMYIYIDANEDAIKYKIIRYFLFLLKYSLYKNKVMIKINNFKSSFTLILYF